MPIPITTLVNRAAELFDTTPKDILGPSRIAQFTLPRHAVAFAADAGGWGRSDIGRRMGGRNHATVGNSIYRADCLRPRDAVFRKKLDELVGMATDYTARFRPEEMPDEDYNRIKTCVYAERAREAA
jgi:chromosomal replication initiator protein